MSNLTPLHATFKPLTGSNFKVAMHDAKNKAAGYIKAVQGLAATCVYYAVMHNESRKTDSVAALLDAAHRRIFLNFVTFHSGGVLEIATPEVKKQYKENRGKTWDKSRLVYIANPSNTKDYEGTAKKANDLADAAHGINWVSFKLPKDETPKDLNLVKTLESLLRKTESEGYAAKDEMETKQAVAFTSFLETIRNGHDLASLTRQIENRLRDEIREELITGMVDIVPQYETKPQNRLANRLN